MQSGFSAMIGAEVEGFSGGQFRFGVETIGYTSGELAFGLNQLSSRGWRRSIRVRDSIGWIFERIVRGHH
ncbi:MAG: hypothetical protein ACRES9_09175 [Gammaproteobacteria bacterium]